MVGASKILTVSYGTFSCTLEGFDDPFNTMTAIAEYFRDLAADDRYFGAEPPTPDAAMLHRIAEREMSRRVEARVQDNGVILRATPEPSAAPAKPAKTAPAATPAYEPDEPASLPTLSESVAVKLQRLRAAAYAAAGPVVDAEIAGASEPAVYAIEPSSFEDLSDEADETEPRQTAAEADAPQPETAPEPQPLMAEATPQADADLPVETEEPAAPEAMQPIDAFETVAEIAEVEAVAFAVPDVTEAHDPTETATPDAMLAMDVADTYAPTTEIAEVEVEAVAFDAPHSDETPDASEAEPNAVEDTSDDAAPDNMIDADAILARIASLARGAAEEPPVDLVADTLPEAAPAAEADDLPEMLDDATEAAQEADESVAEPALEAGLSQFMAQYDAEALQEEDTAEAPASAECIDMPAHEEALDDAEALAAAAIAEIEGTLAAAPTETPMAAPDAGEEAAPEAAATPEPQDDADWLADADAPTEDAPAADLTADAEPVAEDDAREAEEAPVAAEATAGVDAELAKPTSDVVAKIQRARARVIKIRRVAPVEAAPADDADTDAENAAKDTPGEPAIDTAEAEAALDRSLSALRDEPAVVHPTRPVRVTNERDADVQRLIAQTNTEMEGPENRRRLSAIAHLKAAVAATFADRKAGGSNRDDAEESRITAYRGDLERVVRPRRPVSGTGGTEGDAPAKEPARPAPLMLLSEYRVDRPKTAEPAAPAGPVMPVRPRRVAVSNLALNNDQDDDMEEDADDQVEAEDNIFGATKGFAEFAEKLGATALPDLLEAAAVYAAKIEGRPHLSRPQMLRHVQGLLPQDETSREDQLRAFGTLLRQGRIEKVKRGQFAVNESSRYLAEAQKIAP